MKQINLLPWRESARQVKKNRFALTVAGFIIFTLFIVFIYHLYMDGLISHQMARNQFLQTFLTTEGTELGRLNHRKAEQTQMDKDLHFIMSLRQQSYQNVRLLDALTTVVPEGVTLTVLKRVDNKLTLSGKALSDVQITLFMKNMTKSPFFAQPVLTQINSQETSNGKETFFELVVTDKE